MHLNLSFLQRLIKIAIDFPNQEREIEEVIIGHVRHYAPAPVAMVSFYITQEEWTFCHQKNKVSAIKSFRDRYGVGLREAKAVMDRVVWEHGTFFDIGETIANPQLYTRDGYPG